MPRRDDQMAGDVLPELGDLASGEPDFVRAVGRRDLARGQIHGRTLAQRHGLRFIRTAELHGLDLRELVAADPHFEDREEVPEADRNGFERPDRLLGLPERRAVHEVMGGKVRQRIRGAPRLLGGQRQRVRVRVRGGFRRGVRIAGVEVMFRSFVGPADHLLLGEIREHRRGARRSGAVSVVGGLDRPVDLGVDPDGVAGDPCHLDRRVALLVSGPRTLPRSCRGVVADGRAEDADPRPGGSLLRFRTAVLGA